MPTATIPAVGTTTSRRDHGHPPPNPPSRPRGITSGNAAPITIQPVAQHLGALWARRHVELDDLPLIK
jgi:hypothetical protein